METTAHAQHQGGAAGKASRRNRLAGAALVLVAASAGLGAVAQGAFASAGPSHKITVAAEPAVHADFELAHPSEGCVEVSPGTRIVTVSSRVPNEHCSSRSTLESA